MGTYSKFPWRASQPLLPSAYCFPCPCFMYEHPRVVGNHLRRFAFLWHDRNRLRLSHSASTATSRRGAQSIKYGKVTGHGAWPFFFPSLSGHFNERSLAEKIFAIE
ncbi:hypothetical protein CEXT_386011 [Caerostris extrusa]|uniref:Uncharacterized protein n=1 Tax=Caerostris extrusa TaxID=172846 RepID=A0AAV4XSI4_CAEEX|nr:hypothetical protein CEXT_386011 [Caerostris extrusa]